MDAQVDVWRQCYRALLPWTRHDRESLHRQARSAVELALTALWGEVDRERPSSDAAAHAIVAAGEAYGRGWFDAVIGSHVDARARSQSWPASLHEWGVGITHGRGRAFRPTVGELIDFFVNFPFAETLDLIAAADRAARNAAGTPEQRLRVAVTAVLKSAWAEEDKRGWDDAPWYDYLDVGERVGWTAAALDLPDIEPGLAAVTAQQVAAQGAWERRGGWSPWIAGNLPPQFLADVVRALLDLPSAAVGDRSEAATRADDATLTEHPSD